MKQNHNHNHNPKDKLEFCRKKILLRKYGYMFYRKTISPILPSQVEKLYVLNRKKRTFTAWKGLWFDQRAGWRMAIRANLHYAYTLKRSSLKKWQLYLLRKKTKRLQFQIASAYYARKLKIKFLHELMYYAKCYKRIETLRKIFIEQFTLRCLSLEVISVQYRYIELQQKYYLKEFVCIKQKRTCFNKLLEHANEQINEKNDLLRARLLFKSRNFPEMLRPFFIEWRNYAEKSVLKKFKLHLAIDHFKKKLSHRCLLKLYEYKNYRRIKYNNFVMAKKIYETHLKAKCFRCLQEFTNSKIEKRVKADLAEGFYAEKITRECFDDLLKYKNHKLKKRDVLLKISSYLEHKMKEKTFQKLKKYSTAHKIKKAKMHVAFNHYDNKVKRIYFKKYLTFCCNQKVSNYKKINAVLMKREKRLLRNCFLTWKLFRCIRVQKRIKISLAIRKYEIRLANKTILILKQHAKQGKAERKARETRLANLTITKWKRFVDNRILYRSNLHQAKLIYKRNLIKKGLNAILSAAYKKQVSRKNRILEIVEHQLILAQRYFTIWKRKVVRNKSPAASLKSENSSLFDGNESYRELGCLKSDEMMACVEPFVWNCLCFDKPRVPNYLLKSIQNV